MISVKNRNEAYLKVDLNKNQKKVFRAFQTLEKATNQQVAEHLGWEINQVTGRTNELCNSFCLKQIGTDESTGRGRTLFSPVKSECERETMRGKRKKKITAEISELKVANTYKIGNLARMILENEIKKRSKILKSL